MADIVYQSGYDSHGQNANGGNGLFIQTQGNTGYIPINHNLDSDYQSLHAFVDVSSIFPDDYGTASQIPSGDSNSLANHYSEPVKSDYSSYSHSIAKTEHQASIEGVQNPKLSKQVSLPLSLKVIPAKIILQRPKYSQNNRLTTQSSYSGTGASGTDGNHIQFFRNYFPSRPPSRRPSLSYGSSGSSRPLFSKTESLMEINPFHKIEDDHYHTNHFQPQERPSKKDYDNHSSFPLNSFQSTHSSPFSFRHNNKKITVRPAVSYKWNIQPHQQASFHYAPPLDTTTTLPDNSLESESLESQSTSSEEDINVSFPLGAMLRSPPTSSFSFTPPTPDRFSEIDFTSNSNRFQPIRDDSSEASNIFFGQSSSNFLLPHPPHNTFRPFTFSADSDETILEEVDQNKPSLNILSESHEFSFPRSESVVRSNPDSDLKHEPHKHAPSTSFESHNTFKPSSFSEDSDETFSSEANRFRPLFNAFERPHEFLPPHARSLVKSVTKPNFINQPIISSLESPTSESIESTSTNSQVKDNIDHFSVENSNEQFHKQAKPYSILSDDELAALRRKSAAFSLNNNAFNLIDFGSFGDFNLGHKPAHISLSDTFPATFDRNQGELIVVMPMGDSQEDGIELISEVRPVQPIDISSYSSYYHPEGSHENIDTLNFGSSHKFSGKQSNVKLDLESSESENIQEISLENLGKCVGSCHDSGAEWLPLHLRSNDNLKRDKLSNSRESRSHSNIPKVPTDSSKFSQSAPNYKISGLDSGWIITDSSSPFLKPMNNLNGDSLPKNFIRKYPYDEQHKAQNNIHRFRFVRKRNASHGLNRGRSLKPIPVSPKPMTNTRVLEVVEAPDLSSSRQIENSDNSLEDVDQTNISKLQPSQATINELLSSSFNRDQLLSSIIKPENLTDHLPNDDSHQENVLGSVAKILEDSSALENVTLNSNSSDTTFDMSESFEISKLLPAEHSLNQNSNEELDKLPSLKNLFRYLNITKIS